MDAGQGWMAELDDLDEPEEESEFWEDEELTPGELASWFGAVHRAGDARVAGERSIADAGEPGGQPRAEGGVPDLIGEVLGAGGDPALMTDADLVRSLSAWHAVASRAAGRELRATEELLRRRKPRVWDRRADRAQSAREDPAEGQDPAAAPDPRGADEPERVIAYGGGLAGGGGRDRARADRDRVRGARAGAAGGGPVAAAAGRVPRAGRRPR